MANVVPRVGASRRRPRYGTIACDCERDRALRKATLRGGFKADLLRGAACAMAKSLDRLGAQLPFLRVLDGDLGGKD